MTLGFSWSATLAAAAVMIGTGAAAAQEVSLENGLDRKGRDYNRFISPSPDICRTACARDSRCAAFTWVRPHTTQGPQGICWLKSSVPAAIGHYCCVSGVKQGSESDAARDIRNYPEGCAIKRGIGDQVEPRASLEVVNRASHPVYVSVAAPHAQELGSVPPYGYRTWSYVLVVGPNLIAYGAHRGTNRTITLRVTNQGPRTCKVVRRLTYADPRR